MFMIDTKGILRTHAIFRQIIHEGSDPSLVAHKSILVSPPLIILSVPKKGQKDKD